jgi:hypothetical protein
MEIGQSKRIQPIFVEFGFFFGNELVSMQSWKDIHISKEDVKESTVVCHIQDQRKND